MRFLDLLLPHLPKLRTITVIDASSIACAIDELPDEGVTGWPSEMYGNVAPPFSRFFVEARTNIEGKMIERGTLVTVFDLSKDVDPHKKFLHPTQVKRHVRWRMYMQAFLRSPAFGAPLSTGIDLPFIDIGNDGLILHQMDQPIPIIKGVISPIYHLSPHIAVFPPYEAASHAVYTLKAIAALHQQCPVEEVTYPRQARRRLEQSMNEQLTPDETRYYILKVKPRSSGGFAEIGKKEPARSVKSHIVRGFFRYYHPDRPMFGKPGLHGAIWTPDHQRGSNDYGEVKKDYEI